MDSELARTYDEVLGTAPRASGRPSATRTRGTSCREMDSDMARACDEAPGVEPRSRAAERHRRMRDELQGDG